MTTCVVYRVPHSIQVCETWGLWRGAPLEPGCYATAITTPTLTLHDTGDPNVPITDAYLLYHALKDNGVTVKFIAIPVAGHFPNDSPVRESDIYHYWIDWLDQYVK